MPSTDARRDLVNSSPTRRVHSSTAGHLAQQYPASCISQYSSLLLPRPITWIGTLLLGFCSPAAAMPASNITDADIEYKLL